MTKHNILWWTVAKLEGTKVISEKNYDQDIGEVMSEKTNDLVTLTVGTTKNLGNYSSLRVDIGITLTSNSNSLEDINKTYAKAEAFVLEKLESVINQVAK